VVCCSFRDETAEPRVWPQELEEVADICLLMSESGRRRVATPRQCDEVRRLAADGLSLRQIAEDVFGDRRFRGRVERILQAPAAPQESRGGPLIGDEVVSVETVPTVRAALGRYLARIARGDVDPSVAEMVKLLDLDRRLQTLETIEQLNALTRPGDPPAAAD
jgi:hypothetical protein